MGARVSVTSSSHSAGSASRASDSAAATRDFPGASSASGFSSALNAASRPPNDAAGNQESTRSRPTGTSAKPETASTPNGAAAQAAAATIAEAEDSSVDGDLAAQEGQAPSKGGKSKGPNDDSSSVQTDPAALALLLTSGGLQLDPRSGTGQEGADGGSATEDDQTAAALAGSAALSNAAPGALTATQISAATAPAADGSAAASLSLKADLDTLAANATSTSSAADAALLPNKSGAPDGIQPQPAASAANGVAEMIRGLSTGPAQSSGIERTISVPVSDRNWSGAVAGQVQWMVNSDVQSATLQLSPDHLGPLEVRIDVQPSQVNVSFTAAHPDTRSALEQGIPQLRAILANGGLTLGQTSVQQQETRSNSHYLPGSSRSAVSAPQSVDPVSVSSIRGVGLIDEYA